MAGIRWSSKDELKLEQLCNSGDYNFEKIGEILGRTMNSVAIKASDLGIKNKYLPGLKYSYDSNFWDEINGLTSYYAGFVAADGCLHERKLSKGHYNFSIFTSEDRALLERFRADCKSTNPLKTEDRVRDGKFYKGTNFIIHCNDDWAVPLRENFNITPQKTYNLKPPNLPEEMVPYFIKGFTDGDGCLHLNSCNNQFSISYVGASKEFLEWIRDYSYRFKGRRCCKRKVVQNKKHKRCYRFAIHGDSAIKMFRFLQSLDGPYLARKWDNPKFIDLEAG